MKGYVHWVKKVVATNKKNSDMTTFIIWNKLNEVIT